MTEVFNIAQILGYCSLFFGLLSFYQKKDVSLKVLMATSTAFRSVHYIMLDSYTACLMAAISTVRTLISLKILSKYVALFFIVLSVFVGFFVAESLMDWLPILSTVISTVALFFFTGIMMRFGLMLGSIVWLINNFWVGSIGGVLLESFTIIINILTIIRINRDKA
ncbi:YgjV family protein [Vibrio sp. CK2-1]|uniref:YgjV family protein n=1 Tax=Vibrio sp. CK2-1 TaxID=2912249 RepID=UPI001F19ABE5|nr:YgjV family protein [Vibrio sp. CK2-1]MCF7352992.1 YgjV family protein [Vibrio sp. CK2-1]